MMNSIAQLQMIDDVKRQAENDPRVSAVFMYGSFTKDEGDQYSDIEFYIFLKDPHNFPSQDWVSQVSPVILYFTNEYGSDVAIFENLVRGEFHFLSVSEINLIKSWEGLVEFSDFDKMTLVDKEGILDAMLNQIMETAPKRNTRGNILWLSHSLLNVLLVTGNLLKRMEYAHAYQGLANVQKYLLWLIRIADGKTRHWESPTKSLEKDIDINWYVEFQRTTCSLDPKNLKIAFQNSLRLSEKLFVQLQVEQNLMNALRRIH